VGISKTTVGASPTPSSGPSISRDPTLYAAAVSGDARHGTETTSIYAVNARTGALLWLKKEPGSPGIPASSVAVSDGVVYAATTVTTSSANAYTSTGHLYAIAATTGTVIWQQDASNAMLHLFGVTTHLVLTEQSATPGTPTNNRARTLIARSPHTGAELWQQTFFTEQSGYPYPTVVPIALTESALYVALANRGASPSAALYLPLALSLQL
jgi:outer membrane protein assembly factor BamB